MALNLLLVEDNDSTQKMVELTFKDEDVEVSIISNGDEAFQKLSESPPDIVIADIDNAGLTGLELCQKIKADTSLSNIPVLLLANSEVEFEEPAVKESNANGYIAKPFKSVELIDKVVELTDVVVEKSDEFGDEEEEALNAMTPETIAAEGSEDFVFLDDSETIVKLTEDDEIDGTDDSDDVVKSVEIFPEEILEEDEKDIDFSNFLNDEFEEVEDEEVPGVDEVASQVKEIFPYLEDADYNESLFTEDNKVDLTLPDFLQEDTVEPDNVKVESKSSSTISNKEEQVLDKSVLNKMLGEQVQDVIEKLLKDMTKDMLKEAVEKSVKGALEKSFAKMSPKIVKVIEDISWEVIPDLAEVLIKKEIKNLKNGIR